MSDEALQAFLEWADSRGHVHMREHRHSIAEHAWLACDAQYRAELAALRAELESAHAAQRNAEKELSQYMAWYAMAEHQHLHEQRRAEKAEAEVARLRAAIEQAPHHGRCGSQYTFMVGGIKELGNFSGLKQEQFPCDCWKRAAIDAAMRAER